MAVTHLDGHEQKRVARGAVNNPPDAAYLTMPVDALLAGLQSSSAVERTHTATALGGNPPSKQVVDALCAALLVEKALYTRLAICNSLVKQAPESIPALVGLLGRVGNNQHQTLPKKGFYKRNHPLPRDLAARTLIRIGEHALPLLQHALQDGDARQVREAVDAIGHIAFYTGNQNAEASLISLYFASTDDVVLQWKIIRAFESFSSASVLAILKDVIQNHPLAALRWEAVRSLCLRGDALDEVLLETVKNDPHEEVRKIIGFCQGVNVLA